MKRMLTNLRFIFLTKLLRETQFVQTRAFIPGAYVCMDSPDKRYLEIKRLSSIGEVYGVDLQTEHGFEKWAGCFEKRRLLLSSHDFERNIAFLPEENKLIYGGFSYAKTLLNT